MTEKRIVFAGTPTFAAAHLSAILKSQHEVVAVYSQPDRRAGRGKKVLPSPVKELALAEKLTICQPASLRNSEAQNRLKEFGADVLVVVAYGLILPKEILDIPKYGCINAHASLLPRWRGAAPIERALLAGDKVSGITIMQMDEGLDTGCMLLKSEIMIEETDSRDDLENNLSLAGQHSLIAVLDNLQEFQKNCEKQDNYQACYAEKLHKSEALINWEASAETINCQLRAGIGRFPAYSFLNGQRVRLLSGIPLNSKDSLQAGTIVESTKESFVVACKDSLLEVLQIQFPGKKPTLVRDAQNSQSRTFAIGQRFSTTEHSNV
ncbi:MAG: methionyl-tRNA formyltransferase [OM182 bacterium MED-G28]|uniref:Methionyl-tRNA formyltransferase n=1 Tax=OM182 bacterium MED-G28 TaxID=1986256 RepID=A0A2A5WDB5_9GAMM|nr:MAG: methionyl-tRNA formyltransferase [OM182 bacterium MED-G28]